MAILKDQFWFRKGDYQSEALPETVSKTEVEKKEDKKLYCINCKQHITNIEQAISINGTCRHIFTNPAGFVYTVNCYETATACVAIGERTEEYTWFPGYQWQIVLCQFCQLQLGWLFSNSTQFYAFIEDRLTQIN